MRHFIRVALFIILVTPAHTFALETQVVQFDETVQILVTPESKTGNSLQAVQDALDSVDPSYAISKEIASDVFLANISESDFTELQADPTIVVQKNQRRFSMTSSDVLMHIGADVAHAAPYNATGTGYATVIIDTGIRATHSFFSTTGAVFDAITNPSRVSVEHCQSAGYAITDGSANFVLDSSGNKLYEGKSTCNGNTAVPTTINGFTYYSNTIPGTTTSLFGAAAPCNAEYPGFSSGCRHGTHVAGIAAGTAAVYGSTTYSGVAPTSSIIAFNVFTQYTDTGICGGGSMCLSATDADILSALSQVEEMAVAGTKIGAVNMSLGGGSYPDESTCKSDNLVYFYAFARLKALGIPMVIATGNNASRDRIAAPACVPGAYSVGATTISTPGTDAVASYSNISSFIDYLAPGTSFTSANSNDDTSFWTATGTSMATPVVAGAFTVLRSLFDGTHSPYPLRSLDSIADALKSSAVLLNDTRIDGGVVTNIPRINIAAAISRLANIPYIALPNSSTLSLSYPLVYNFSVSSAADIDASAIVTTGATTAPTSIPSCTAITTSSYNCSTTITSPGNLQLTVTDTAMAVYTSPVVEMSALPVISSVATTVSTGTYGVGTSIPITIVVTGLDSPVLAGSNLVLQLSNTAVVTLTAPNPPITFTGSSIFSGIYTVGDVSSGQDVTQLSGATISTISINESDGTHYTAATFTPIAGSNLDQSGKILTIKVTPTIIIPQASSGGGGGGGGSAVPVTLAPKDKELFCTSTLMIPLVEGSTGKDVLLAETILKQLGYFGSLPNTDYNSATTLAVLSLQQKHSPSHVTGGVDTQTWEIMKFASGCSASSPKRNISNIALNRSANTTQKELVFTKTLKTGSVSPLVADIRIGLVELGYLKKAKKHSQRYNSVLTRAVRKFQKKYKITVTGTIDKKTFDTLQHLLK